VKVDTMMSRTIVTIISLAVGVAAAARPAAAGVAAACGEADPARPSATAESKADKGGKAHLGQETARAVARRREVQRGQDHTETVTRTLRVGPAGHLDLFNLAGAIEVVAGGAGEVRLQAVKRVRTASDEDAKRQLALVDVEIAERPDRAEIRSVYRTRRGVNVAVDYLLTVPAAMNVVLKGVAGDMRVRGLKGDLQLETISGNVQVDAAGRQATIKSVSGLIEILSLGADSDLRISNISGGVRARDLKVRSLDLGTVSGDVVLNEVACDRASIRSIQGTLDYTGELRRNGQYELRTHSGGIRLAIPAAVGFDLNASTFSGEIRSDLPVTLVGGGPPPRRTLPHRTLRGRYGDGAALLTLVTFSGSVTITKR
jgi:hypothetical protein